MIDLDVDLKDFFEGLRGVFHALIGLSAYTNFYFRIFLASSPH